MTQQLDPAEARFRQACRDEVVRRGRESGRLQEFCTQPVDGNYLPHIAAEDAQQAADFMVERGSCRTGR